jgi:hypothetical protein
MKKPLQEDIVMILAPDNMNRNFLRQLGEVRCALKMGPPVEEL